MSHLNRRTFIASCSAPLLACLIPKGAQAAFSQDTVTVSFIQGSDQWRHDSPQLRDLLKHKRIDPNKLINAQTLRSPTSTPTQVRLTLRPLAAEHARLTALGNVSLDVVAAPHRIPFRAFAYNAAAPIDTMTRPIHLTVPLDPQGQLELRVQTPTRPHTILLGSKATPLHLGTYIISVREGADHLAIAARVDTTAQEPLT